MSRFEHQPLVRHAALAPFSRDHYTGLVQAQRLIQAADGDAAARRQALAAFADAWRLEIAVHFCDEERLLVPCCADADRQRLLTDHQQITAMAQRALDQRRQVNPEMEVLRELGFTLQQHIRWEERELFERLQGKLTPAQLQGLQGQTHLLEQSRPRYACRNKPEQEPPAP